METSETSFWDFKGIDEYNDNKFLIRSPYPIVLILVTYLLVVLKIGPHYMKNRPPMNFRNLLVAYNAFLVLISGITAAIGIHSMWEYGVYSKTCMVEKHLELRNKLVDVSHIYFLTKVVELTETFFFVLRKKQRQVSFLHVYHHTIMVMANWLITKYCRTDATVFLGTINSLVHVIMYTYYALSAYPDLVKYLWWKKYITIFQLVQFLLMFMHVVASHIISECQPAYYLLSAVCFNTIFFIYLFGDFYIKSYNKKYKNKQVPTTEKSIELNMDRKSSINYIINHHKLAGKVN